MGGDVRGDDRPHCGQVHRVEPRRRARTLLLGLLSDLPDKNCWTISEHVGDDTPDGIQHLLRKAVCDAEEIRDDLRDYVTEHLGDTGAVLVVDETGDLKKGVHTVGVQRQYTGTAGRVENAQVAVYLSYATDTGHAFIDRALCRPSPGPAILTAAPRLESPLPRCSRRNRRWRPR